MSVVQAYRCGDDDDDRDKDWNPDSEDELSDEKENDEVNSPEFTSNIVDASEDEET